MSGDLDCDKIWKVAVQLIVASSLNTYNVRLSRSSISRLPRLFARIGGKSPNDRCPVDPCMDLEVEGILTNHSGTIETGNLSSLRSEMRPKETGYSQKYNSSVEGIAFYSSGSSYADACGARNDALDQ